MLEAGCELGQVEREMTVRALDRVGGNVTRAAKLLGLSRAALDYRLKKNKF
jgi:two-component system NtrC family response regulator